MKVRLHLPRLSHPQGVVTTSKYLPSLLLPSDSLVYDDDTDAKSGRTGSCNVSHNIPSLFLTNCNRVLNKLDELHLVANSKAFDIIALTESWLNEDIDDSVLVMSGYSLFRKDRYARIGGGILCYISNAIPVWSPTLETSNDDDFEIMWLILRPRVLPRPMSVVALAVVYCPPWFNVDMCKRCCRYILDCADELSRKYPNLLLLICGDFNTLNCFFSQEVFI